MPIVDQAIAEQFASRLLTAAGADVAQAACVARHLVAAESSGYPSHGLGLLSFYLDELRDGRIEAGSRPAVRRIRAGALSVDGSNGFGQVAVDAAIGPLLAETRATACAVARFQRVGHVGRLAPYVEALSAEGRIGLMVAGFALDPREAIVAAGAGSRRFFGTNPIAFCFPGSDAIDVATAGATAFGALRALRSGAPLPEGVAVDAAGRATVDPALVFDGGALLPMGGHKGAALSLLTVLLGALSGEAARGLGGVVLLAIDAETFLGASGAGRVSGALAAASEGRPPDLAPIRLAGQRAAALRRSSARDGIAMAPDLCAALAARASALRVEAPGGWA